MNDSQVQIEVNFSPAREKLFDKMIPFKRAFIQFVHTPNLNPILKSQAWFLKGS